MAVKPIKRIAPLAAHNQSQKIVGLKAGNMPDDYEECGECGYDHTYEYVEASEAHAREGRRIF